MDDAPSNLPVPITSFVGRESEREEITRLLGTNRLLTLFGAGGVGKTRLAVQVAQGVRGRFADGVRLVDLAPLTDRAFVPHAVAAALDIREQDGEPLTETLIAALRPRELLLLLDNCDYVADSCAELVDALLRSCPRLRVLATSREALDSSGEAIWPVPSLTLPKPGQSPSVEEAAQFESVRLFAERARLALPPFALDDHNIEAVVEICRQLDGIPLAIELAAARLRVLTVEEVSVRLQDRFRLLTSGGRTAAPRHQTLRALVDWSHDLLSDPERALFRRLAVFAGGWTLAAAESMCAGLDEGADNFALLTQLVEKSLVLADRGASETRYRMFETIRQYGAEKLREADEEVEVRSQHLKWMLTLAREAEVGFRGPQQLSWFQRVETELDNVRSALTWSSTAPGMLVDGLQLAGTLWQFWWLRGHAPEGQRWLSALLARASTEPSAEGASRALLAARGRAMTAVGFLAHKQRHIALARSVLLEARAIWHELGDKRLLALTLRELGHTALEEDDLEAARHILDEGLALAEQVGSRQQRHDMLFPLGLLHRRSGEWDQAQALFEECVALGREEGDLRRVALPLLYLGSLLLDRGLLAAARSTLLESMTTHHQAGIRAGLAPALELLACLEATEGRPERALCLAGAAAAIAGSLGATEAAYLHAQDQAEKQLDVARRRLGVEAAAAKWSEGGAMTVEEALAHALEGTVVDAKPVSRIPSAACPLTGREEEVAELVARGMTNRQIGAALVISEWTAKRHVENILHRLGLESRAQIAAWTSERRST
jgi:predicted ATPase/DNA-binding CsgD family transcriptional regulator